MNDLDWIGVILFVGALTFILATTLIIGLVLN
jgi:hypothetical protein